MAINQRHSHSGRGNDGERIDYNDLKNKPEDSTLKYYQENDTQFTGVFTAGDYTYNVGFRPKKITFQAVRTNNNFGWSHGYAIVDTDGDIQNCCQFKKGGFTNAWNLSPTKCIYIDKSVSMTAHVTAVSDTGFTLNVDNNNYNFDLMVIAEGV